MAESLHLEESLHLTVHHDAQNAGVLSRKPQVIRYLRNLAQMCQLSTGDTKAERVQRRQVMSSTLSEHAEAKMWDPVSYTHLDVYKGQLY